MSDDPKAIERRILELALADIRRAEKMLPGIDQALEIIEGKGRTSMSHDTVAPHIIQPRFIWDGSAYCAFCDALLSQAEVDAINRDREVHAANLRLVEGPGPAEMEAEDENSRLD